MWRYHLISVSWKHLSAVQRLRLVVWTILGVALLTFALVGVIAFFGAPLTPHKSIAPALTGAVAGQAYITYLKLRGMPLQARDDESDS